MIFFFFVWIENQQLRKLFYTKDLIDEYVDENGTKKFRILRNKFNFSDRNAQTFNQITRVSLNLRWFDFLLKMFISIWSKGSFDNDRATGQSELFRSNKHLHFVPSLHRRYTKRSKIWRETKEYPSLNLIVCLSFH